MLLTAKILDSFYENKIVDSYGLIGGLAVGSLGIPRATKDVDFLVSAEDINNFYDNFKKALGKNFILELNKPEYRTFPYYSIICSTK